eukprot:1904911-Amphidinium_carterae.1
MVSSSCSSTGGRTASSTSSVRRDVRLPCSGASGLPLCPVARTGRAGAGRPSWLTAGIPGVASGPVVALRSWSTFSAKALASGLPLRVTHSKSCSNTEEEAKYPHNYSALI